ncbi:MAG: D-alanyl-D-alanine carboxypeptidase [Rubrivivax sp.]|nr:D-alanyl-D-alanine carboxypeptidase [Rubrivivax sp.]HOW47922.1 D-alanyl-D-alanine carboxypeptidase family protein [Rubrivivax sp.]HRY89101.1 D-alanyl-D-alanine carboxypeptidase family protein [Rubrivivax sp.]
MNRLIAFLSAALFAAGALAQIPQPPEVAARSFVLVDLTSQQVLAEREADARADPASLTKLMTAYLVFAAIRDGKLSLEQSLPVSTRAWAERKGGGSLMFIDTTMTPRVDELLRGVIVQSGNDASVVLAEAVGGTLDGFVAMMNKQAQAWGLKNTQFRNVTGLTEPGHYSSARDVATVAARIITDFPEFYKLYSIRQYTYNRIKQDNRNLLLGRDPTVDGMKTGYTDSAGYCLVASAIRDMPNGKRRLLSVVLGTASREARAAESQKLLNWGFSAWDAVRLFDDGQPVATVPVWKGTVPQVKLGVSGALFVTVPKGEGDKLKTQVERTDPLIAPLTQGQQVGTVKISTAGGAPVRSVPLLVTDAVPLAGVFSRTWDAFRLWIK